MSRASVRLLAVLCAFAWPSAVALAQQTGGLTITGRVTSETGTAVPSASVALEGMALGALTDTAGRYSFVVPAARANGQQATLTARRIGFQARSVGIALRPGQLVQDFQLTTSPVQLTGVVVTALGLEREKSRLGTSQQQLSSTELNTTKSDNLVNQLEGKVSGVSITAAGTQGGSTRIVIRGANSFTGNNQPLFIVDGIPISNSQPSGGMGIGGSPNGGYDYGSAINDINPDDIASISVLKGPNAAAIYGSRAANGAILITTKQGAGTEGRLRTEGSITYTRDRPSILPTYQNRYGQGAQGDFRFVDGAGSGKNDGADQSWGPPLDGQPIDQFTGQAQPWVPQPDNVKSFFNTGRTLTADIGVSGGTERANARLSVGAQNTDGYIPNNYLKRVSALLTGSLTNGKRFSTTGTLQYLRNSGQNRPGTGYNVGILEQFIWFGRQVDMNALRANWMKSGTTNGGPASREFNWNYNYHNNPFWLQYANPINDSRDRFIASASASYNFTDWLKATLRSGSDIFRFNVDERFAPGNLNFSDPSYAGAFSFYNDYRNENNTELLFSGSHPLTSGLTLDALAGGNVRTERYNRTQTSTSGISVAGIYNVGNAAITPTLSQYTERRQVNSLYGSASLTWRGWWTVEGTARNDWSSTLPAGKNSYFYPSVNTSVVLTDAIPSLRTGWLSFAKVRGSVARVGNDAPPYSLVTTYAGLPNKFTGLPQFTLSNTIKNPSLKPEITTAGEAGIELGLLNGRIALDATYYTKTTRNQIFNIPISPTSGFTSKSINAGRVDNRGVEALLTVTPVDQTNGFRWTSTFNFSRNRSKVVELASGITTLVLGSSWYTNIEARQGEPYGTIYGYAFKRDSAGNLLTSGGYTQLGGRKVLGNIQPDWTGGWSNTISYRGVSLYGLFDIKRGGDIVSVSNFFGEYSGVFASTLRGREARWDSPGIVVKGIDEETGQPNTTTITSEQYFQNIFPVIEPYVYDGSYVKLRELRLTVQIPSRLSSRVGVSNATVALIGRNLWTSTDVPNIDPEFSYTTGNFQGIEFGALPNARSLGFQLRLTP